MTWKLLSCVTLAFTLAIGTIVQANSEDKQGTERISQPREFSGIWLVEFEGSTFFEGAENPPNEIVWGTEHGVWLKWNGESGLTKADLAHDPELGCYPVYPFRLTFVGQERTGAVDTATWGIGPRK